MFTENNFFFVAKKCLFLWKIAALLWLLWLEARDTTFTWNYNPSPNLNQSAFVA